jgi:hypothetical protein
VIQTARNGGGLLGGQLLSRQSPLLNPPALFGPSSPLPLGILKRPLFGGPSR